MVIHGAVKWQRQYVGMVVLRGVDGTERPMRLIWPDGRDFAVHPLEYQGVKRCERTGGSAQRTLALVGTRSRYLYRDARGWFVEVNNQQSELE